MVVELWTELQFFAINSQDILKGLLFYMPVIHMICGDHLALTLILSCRFAYIEFTDKDGVENAVTMDDSLFKGRQIKVHYAIVCSSFDGYFIK